MTATFRIASEGEGLRIGQEIEGAGSKGTWICTRAEVYRTPDHVGILMYTYLPGRRHPSVRGLYGDGVEVASDASDRVVQYTATPVQVFGL